MQTINVELFTINELSEQARQKAIEKERVCREVFLDPTVEYIEEILTCLGFQSPKISYSGFGSQGDGLSFTSDNWQYKKGMLDKVWDITRELCFLNTAKQLQVMAKNTGYKLQFSVNRTSHRYAHHNTVQIENSHYSDFSLSDDQDAILTDLKNSLCRVFYRMLESGYDYQLTDEYIIENLQANDVMFLSSGKAWSV
jgi:hypothetical protein